jgi:peptidoglycan/LPS O-acetylase OafA/YrhL
MITPLLSARMNCMRWVAALLVVMSHLKPILFVEYADLKEKGLLIDFFYLITGLGHEAVIVFFVMSGLLVGGLSVARYRTHRFIPSEFMIQRFSRIYIVLIPALLVGFMWDQLGLTHFNTAGLYTETPKFRLDGIAANQLSWHLLIENGLMMQHISVPILGSNGALWSISYEWWCYVFFLFGFVFMASCMRREPRFHYGLFAFLLLALLPLDVLRYFVIWLIGLAVLFSPLRKVRCSRLLGYGMLLLTVLWSRFNHDNAQTILGIPRGYVCDVLVTGACFFLFTALNQGTMRRTPGRNLHKLLADFSYTTYLVHLPFMILVISLLNRFFDLPLLQQPSPGGVACFLFIGLLIYFYSYCFSRMTERHTDALRNWLHGWLSVVMVKR